MFALSLIFLSIFCIFILPHPNQPDMQMKILIPGIIFSFFSSLVFGQNKSNVKFGKVSPDDFARKVYSIDSNASAVVIAEIGSTEFVGNNKGWFSLEFKHFRRVHILNKNGYDEANVEIPLYSTGDQEEEVDNVKAITYNLENGKVVETKLDKGSVFKDKISKHIVVKKFTFPNIKEGSIIEYEYKVKSDFLFNLQPWEFQGGSPVLWSEYNVGMPQFFGYVILTQGYQTFYISDRKDRNEHYTVRETRGTEASQTATLDASVTDFRWVMKDVPALKEESFTSTLRNHIAKIEFQFSDYRYPLTPRNVMGTWPEVCTNLLKAEYFGASLNKNNGWLGDVVSPLISGVKDDLEKSKRIYTYVRDNLTCTSHSASDLDQSLKNVLKTRNGTVAEINLLLVAMLKYANVQADPVMLSTRSHGYTYSLYPLLDRFNYVVCSVNAGGENYYLDASQPRLGFGRLTPSCYNGHARVINSSATPLEFSADSLMERKLTSVLLNTDDKGNWAGSMQQTPGYYESHEDREKIKEKGKDEFFKGVKKAYGLDVDILNPKVDSLNNLEESIAIGYDFKLNQGKEDILYFNPMFGEGYKENPFKSAERFYPVEMPYGMDETYVFSMIIPDGYVVDEIPKSTIVKLNENDDGQFEYRISESGGAISLRSRIILRRAYYLPDEYEILREFFNIIVKKHNEQIVLKKKK